MENKLKLNMVENSKKSDENKLENGGQESKSPKKENTSGVEFSEQVFARSISDTKEYLRVNGKIDPETIEIMTGMPLDKTLETMEKFEHLKLELSVKELKEAVAEALNTLEEPARENWLRKVLNKPAVRAIFVTVMLFLKFAPEVRATETKELDQSEKNKTEAGYKKVSELDNDNTYQMSGEDLDKMTGDDSNKDVSNTENTTPEKFIDFNSEQIKNVIVGQEYDKIISNPYLISSLYYSQKFIDQLSDEKNQNSFAKKIIGSVADFLTPDFRAEALNALEEQSKALESSENKKISNFEVPPFESFDLGHGINHNDAIDLYVQEGTEIKAMNSGIVVLAEDGWQLEDEASTSSFKGGNTVIIYNYLTKEFYRYAHLDEVSLHPGQLVMAGEKLGTVGHSGTNACQPGHGNHLHLEINKYDEAKQTNASVLSDELKQRLENSMSLASN